MTDESQALIEQVIEKIAEAGATDFWKRLFEEYPNHVCKGMTWETASEYQKESWRDTMRAAFYAQHGIARVVPLEATNEILTEMFWGADATAADYMFMVEIGDLTARKGE